MIAGGTMSPRPAWRWFARRGRLCVAASLGLLLGASPAHGSSTGIASTVFAANVGCNQCHNGGIAPEVSLEGPALVDPGSTSEYTFTIFATDGQDHGGLNASASDGVLSTGGAFAGGTRTIAGSGGRDEVTHMSPKAAGEGGVIQFSFFWTAPDSFESATFRVWGNAVNFNGNQLGDRASSADLEVASSGEVEPTPTSTPSGPTPTATPEPLCLADLEPPSPLLVSDPDAQKCQDAIGKAGTGYVSGSLKAVQKCLASFQKGKLSGDPMAVCVSRGGLPLPSDADTVTKLSAARSKASATIQSKCTDTTIAELGLCGSTVTDFENCFFPEHWLLIENLIEHEFGSVAASDNKEEQKCQKAIAGAAGKYVASSLKAMQKCLGARNKQSIADDAGGLCLGSVAGGDDVPPADAKAASAIGKAEATLRSKVAGSCTNAALVGLDTCASDLTDVQECLVCTHRAAVFTAIGVEYGGAGE
jgi:hypothetical protein